VVTSALSRPPSLVHPPSRDDVVTSVLPRQPPCVSTGTSTFPPHTDDVMTSMLPRPPAHMPPHDVLTSALTRLPTVPGSVPMQRPAARVDDCNVYTHGIEQLLLPELPQPPPVHRQMPLLSDNKQTTASDYVNQDPVPVLTAHRSADTPFDINYQNIPDNLSLPPLSTHVNVPTYVNVPPSQAITFGQPGLSAFSRVDALQNQPIAVDPAVQYTVGTSVSNSSAPLQSPSVHWRKQLVYDYVQPDTALGAPTHVAPAIHSGYIRPQISDTHTLVGICKPCHLEVIQ